MGMPAWWRGVVAGLVVGSLGAGCAADKHRPFFHRDQEDMPEFSASNLGDGFSGASVWELLTPEERQAVERSRMSPPPPGETAVEPADERAPRAPATDGSPDEPQGAVSHALDKAGKVSVALLGVGVTLGAMVAPFFLL